VPKRRNRRLAGGRGGAIRAVVVALAALLAPGAAMALASDFEHPASHDTSQQFLTPNVQRVDKPNDRDYDNAEPGGNQPSTTNFYDERFDLFGFASALTPGAVYTDGPNAPGGPGGCLAAPCHQIAGFNAAGAWKLARGRPDVVIAILDTGIKWDRAGLRTQVHLNTGELPLPEDAAGHTNPGAGHGGFDLNGDGAVNVDDFANDPRVPTHTGAGGKITGEDLIKAFGHCQIQNHVLGACPAGGKFDNDHNGFPNDIAGWDFFDDDNDPLDQSSYFAAENHGSGRASDAAERGNDGDGSLGTCPHCQLMPIRTWDTFVSDGNTFGQGVLYATDNGASVIEGANGSLDHTPFMEHASEYAYQHNVVQTFSGDDLNTGNHNYPAAYPHAMLIEGTVPDTMGLGQSCSGGQPVCDFIHAQQPAFGSNLPVGTFFRGANTTQFGGKSSISMTGSTGSINTGLASGGAGLVVSAARDAGTSLRADEVREILEQTAEDVTPGNTGGTGTPDPAQTGWDVHFGWGRANLGKAVSVAADTTRIPDQATIDAPDWYAPLTQKTLHVVFHADARFTAGHKLHYLVEWGAGLAPTTWMPVKHGDVSGPIASFADIDLDTVRSKLASFMVPADAGGPIFSPTSPNPFQQQFAVRVTVTDPTAGTHRLPGVDRRVFTALKDPDLRPGYPKQLGTGGEAQPRYADLNGDNVPELIVPTEDGTIHAYEPDGSELPGWPVHTQVQWTALDHMGAPGMKAVASAFPPREAPRGPAVADLNGDGEPDVITTAGIHIYAWHPDGTLLKGFPVSSNRSFCGSALEQQGQDNPPIPAQHPKCGFVASPAIGHLEGPGNPPDIVVPSLDGHLYAIRPDGTAVPHFPRVLQDPGVPANKRQIAESINEVAIVDLNKDGYDDAIAATNEAYGGSGASDVSFAGLLGSQGQSARVYAVNGHTGALMPGWPIKIAGIIENVLPFIGPGADPAVADLGGPKVFASATSGSLSSYNPNGSENTTMRQEDYGPASNAVDKSPGLNLFESAAIGKLTSGAPDPDVVKYEVSTGAAASLLLVGQNFPWNHLIGAWNASTGNTEPAFPVITDDYQFVSSSLIAKVDRGSSANQVLAGNGLGMIHAYDGATGLDAPHFPKVTGGWVIAPPALADDGTRMAAITREGFLFEWKLAADACQSEWPVFRHDDQNTGDYNADGTPPAAPANVSLARLGHGMFRLRFTSPGDDRFCGTAKSYRTLVDGQPRDLGLGAPVAGGKPFTKDVKLPSGAGDLTIQAIDDGKPASGGAKDNVNPGNVGQAADVAVPPPVSGHHQICRGSQPTSVISKRLLSLKHKRFHISGHAVGGRCVKGKRVRARARHVEVSLALVTKGRCRFLGPRGRLAKRSRPCARRVYLLARLSRGINRKGWTSWSLKRSVHLPSGRYVISVRAIGADGLPERIARSSNSAALMLR
jgi:subtilase family protein